MHVLLVVVDARPRLSDGALGVVRLEVGLHWAVSAVIRREHTFADLVQLLSIGQISIHNIWLVVPLQRLLCKWQRVHQNGMGLLVLVL